MVSLLENVDLYHLIPLGVEDMDRAGETGIERMDCPKDFQRLVLICHRCPDQGRFIGPPEPPGIAWGGIPGGWHHCLIIENFLVFDLYPVPEGAAWSFVQAITGSFIRPACGVPLFVIVGVIITFSDIIYQLVEPFWRFLGNEKAVNAAGGGSAEC